MDIPKTEEEWRARLTPEQFQVLRIHGTERAGTSPLNSEHREGMFRCAGCGVELFTSATKFDSGTGWPSFTQPVTSGVVAYHLDTAYGMQRIEALCNVCDAHLGHVFPDGPPPTGLRFCINAVSLRKAKEPS